MAKKKVLSKKSAISKTTPRLSRASLARRACPRGRSGSGQHWRGWRHQSGAISSIEVIEAHIERMRAVNPKLNAVVVDLSEEALKAAKAADNARAKGTELGLLHRVPITIKENVDYEGKPNPNGVPAQMNIIAPSDAPVVRNRWRDSGSLAGENLHATAADRIAYVPRRVLAPFSARADVCVICAL